MGFKEQILNSGILDPIGTHHEFASGKHGRKLDFDVIADDSVLYNDWVKINAEIIEQSYKPYPRQF